MARGMAANEPIVSQANSAEFEAGYSRTFGDKPPQRGRWVWDAEQGKLVSADEYRPPDRALDAPILSGRFYENTQAQDGTDIGSRRKRREYMKANDLADVSDYTNHWQKAAERRAAMSRGDFDHKERKEAIARAAYQLENRRGR